MSRARDGSPPPPSSPSPPSSDGATDRDRRPPDDTGASSWRAGDAGDTVPAATATTSDGELTAEDGGKWLGKRYRVKQLLGRGGMGEVYRAVDLTLGKDVAIKLMRSVHGGAEGLRRLREEVRLAQRVTHRNVCRTYDLEEIDELLAVKMECLEGEALDARLRRDGVLPIALAVEVTAQVAAGLEAAHAQRVVHRDLKPQNIFLEDGTGRVVLMDFGVARLARRSPGVDGGGDDVSGTPAYMAPEQGLGGIVDGRADLYALGCVLCCMLTGQPPFHAATPRAYLRCHLEEPAPDPRLRRVDVPAWLAAVALRLLEKDPARRYPDATALVAALAGPSPPPSRRPARPRLLATGTGVTALVAAALAAGVWSRRPTSPPTWHARIEERRPVYDENAAAPVISPDGKWLAYISDREGGWRLFLEPLVPGGAARAITPATVAVRVPRWLRDGSGLLFGDFSATVHRVGLDGLAPETLLKDTSLADDCGGGRLVVAHAADAGQTARLGLRDADGSERLLWRAPASRQFNSLRCDPAGRRATFDLVQTASMSRAPADVYVISLEGAGEREPLALTTDRRGNRHPVFVPPDGRTIVFSSDRGDAIDLWEVAVTGGPARRVTSGPGPFLHPDVSPDGRTLIFDDDSTSIPLFARDLDRGAERKISRKLDEVTLIEVTPDGAELVCGLTRELRPLVVAVGASDGEERVIAEGTLRALSLDGKEVYYSVPPAAGDGEQLLVVPRAGGAARLMATLPSPIGNAAVGGDGLLHFGLLEPGSGALRLPAGGGAPVVEAAPPWASLWPSPARDPGFVLARQGRDARAPVLLLGPGPLDAAPRYKFPANALARWTRDGRAVLYQKNPTVLLRDVATGEDRTLAQIRGLRALALSPDGRTLYFTRVVAHVRRESVGNFADRPPLVP